jgi:predicted permease
VPLGDTERSNWLGDLWRDVRYAGPNMRKSPGFVAFVVVTLGLGIGANTTVFTALNTLLLHPLPVPRSGELVAVNAAKLEHRSQASTPLPLPLPDVKDLQAKNSVFSSMAGYTSPRPASWQTGKGSQGIFVELATANYFQTLELKPVQGRYFTPDEDTAASLDPVAVLNYGTWQTRFGGRDDVIGSTLRINNIQFTVIGVAPANFIGLNVMFGPDVWVPSRMAERLFATEMKDASSDRAKTLFQAVGRLKPGVSQAAAQANVAAIASSLAREFPATNEDRTAMVRPLRDAMFSNNGSPSSAILFGGSGLLAVVGIVLLIACSNVANLLMARAAGRQQELAVRLAIGADRWRLLRQLLTESVILGLFSGVAGVFTAYAALRLIFHTFAASANFVSPRFDPTVFAFALVVSLATGFLFGTAPALKATGMSVAESLKEEARTMGRSRSRISLGNALLVGQVAFSFLLLVTAGLFLRSIGRAYAMDPGFQTAHLVVFMTSPGQAGWNKARTQDYYKEVRARVERLPGVQSVSWASNFPLWARVTSGLEVEGRQAKSRADRVNTIITTVDRDYFATSGVGIESGRPFTEVDQEKSMPVAIVNEKLAQQYWPGQDALGKRVRLPSETVERQVVGVARNANYSTWGEPAQDCVYVPMTQSFSDAMILYVRSKGEPSQVLAPVQQQLHEAGPLLRTSTTTGEQVVSGGLFFARMGVALLTVFGLLALGLASIGLYGILAYAVKQRQREIGLRLALGAGRQQVLGLILKQGMSLVAVGVVAGLVAALAVGKLVNRMLYGVSPADPFSIAGAAVILVGIALLACYLPARWATRVDPLVALREG